MTRCHACGSDVPEGARFCQNCGAELGEAWSVPGDAYSSPSIPVAQQTVSPVSPMATASNVPSPYAYPTPPYPIVPPDAYAPTRNGKAIAGMWLGIASIVPGVLLSWIGIVLGIVGLILSAIALSEMRRPVMAPDQSSPATNRSQAVAGLILSIIGIVSSTAFLIYLLNNLERFGVKLTT
jgi:hypothetical protein